MAISRARGVSRPRLMGNRALWAAGMLAALGLWQIEQGGWLLIKARLAQVLLHRAWTRTLAGESEVKPWPWADTWPVARMVVPKYGVDLIILAGANGRTLAFGPGRLETSAGPGWNGTAILSGHRDTHFRFLERVAPGDEIQLHTPGTPPVRYRVQAIEVVDARVAKVGHEADLPTLVMVTCYPFDALVPGGPLRYIVTAEATQ